MMEHVKTVPANTETVKELLSLALRTPADSLAPRLREYGRERLDAHYPSEQLYADLIRTYETVSALGLEEREDAVLDVMDFLTGWCAPDARLY